MGFKKAVLGLSGGIDSALVAVLAAHALGPDNVLGISLPGPYSSGGSLTDATDLAKKTGIRHETASIKFIYSTVKMELKAFIGDGTEASGLAPLTHQNIQARLRCMVLMALSNRYEALCLTTGNKSESAVGYCTLYGDMAGALAPIGDLYKTKVYQLARWIQTQFDSIPESSITKPPSAELSPNQKDEDSLGSYDDLDRLLELYLENQTSREELYKQGFEKAYVDRILKLIHTAEHKRYQAAPILKVTGKSFGIGRRIPLVKAF